MNKILLICFFSMVCQAQSLKMGAPAFFPAVWTAGRGILKTISDAVSNTHQIEEEAQKREAAIQILAPKKSHLETVLEREKRIKTLREEMIEARHYRQAGSKSAQELETELLELEALGLRPDEDSEDKEFYVEIPGTSSPLLLQKSAKIAPWQVPGMKMAPAKAAPDSPGGGQGSTPEGFSNDDVVLALAKVPEETSLAVREDIRREGLETRQQVAQMLDERSAATPQQVVVIRVEHVDAHSPVSPGRTMVANTVNLSPSRFLDRSHEEVCELLIQNGVPKKFMTDLSDEVDLRGNTILERGFYLQHVRDAIPPDKKGNRLYLLARGDFEKLGERVMSQWPPCQEEKHRREIEQESLFAGQRLHLEAEESRFRHEIDLGTRRAFSEEQRRFHTREREQFETDEVHDRQGFLTQETRLRQQLQQTRTTAGQEIIRRLAEAQQALMQQEQIPRFQVQLEEGSLRGELQQSRVTDLIRIIQEAAKREEEARQAQAKKEEQERLAQARSEAAHKIQLEAEQRAAQHRMNEVIQAQESFIAQETRERTQLNAEETRLRQQLQQNQTTVGQEIAKRVQLAVQKAKELQEREKADALRKAEENRKAEEARLAASRRPAERTARTVAASAETIRLWKAPNISEGQYQVPIPPAGVGALEWELGRKGSKEMTFKEAQAYAASRAADGWRLPTIWELYALYQQKNVLGDDLDTVYFWSDTVVAGHVGGHWFVGFADGSVRLDGGGCNYRVRLVRVGRGF